MPIIHISGPIGSGKSTLGKELSGDSRLSNYTIYDLDDLRVQYKKKCQEKSISGKDFARMYAKGYQRFLDKIVKKHCMASMGENRPSENIEEDESFTLTSFKKIAPPNIIFVGLACYIFGEKYEYNGNWYVFPKVRFNLRADHKFYINISAEQNIKQIYNREFGAHLDSFCRWLKDKEDQIFRNLLEDEKTAHDKIFKMLVGPFNFTEHKIRINGWAREHTKHDYVFATPQKIYKKILIIIDKKESKGPVIRAATEIFLKLKRDFKSGSFSHHQKSEDEGENKLENDEKIEDNKKDKLSRKNKKEKRESTNKINNGDKTEI